MTAFEIKPGIFSVGVLNPSLRVFDIVMTTEYGTSYNSYLVKGKTKTALIEGCHKTYLKHFLDNINQVGSVSEIDYVVLNHNEPDHTGAVAELIKANPNIEVYCSQAGSIYIKAITNQTDLKLHVIKDGEELDLGGRTLKFYSAPFLHWPDSMLTWLPEEKILFSCDFLGSHYCEPFYYDYNIAKEKGYRSAFKGYYDAIFGPFPGYVQKGLAIVEGLQPEMVCPSHGPVLTRESHLPYTIEQYQVWSTVEKREKKMIPVFYCSAYGNTRALAKEIQAGILEVLSDAECVTYDIIKHEMVEMAGYLNRCDAFALGTPTINRDAVPPVWMLLAHVDAINSGKKPALLFGSYGWSGEGVGNVKARLEGLKMKVYEEQFKVTFVPSVDDLKKARALGKAFAETI